MRALPTFLRRPLLIVGLLALVALVAAACDDDDDGKTLKIAFLADFSGSLAEFGPEIQKGVELAIKHINEGGGVFGNDVELVIGDTQLDETAAVEEARRLVEIEGAHAIVGPLSSAIAIAVAESVTGDAEVPTVSPSATSPLVTGARDNGFLFRSTISDAAQAPVLADLVASLGFDHVGVLFINDAYGQGLADGFEAAFGGTVNKVAIDDGQASYLAELQQAAGGGAQALIAISFPEAAKVYLREALENDIFDTFVFVDGTKSQELIDEIGAENLDGFRGTAPVGGPANPSQEAWEAAYTAEYGELPTLPFVREAYDATIAIALAAALADSTDGAAIRDAMVRVASPGGEVVIPGAESIKRALELVNDGIDVNYEGVATTLDWNDAGDVTTGFVGIWRYAGGTIEELETVPFSLE